MYVKKLVLHESQDKPRKVAQARLGVGRNFEVMHHSKERQRGMCTPQRIDAGMRSLKCLVLGWRQNVPWETLWITRPFICLISCLLPRTAMSRRYARSCNLSIQGTELPGAFGMN